MSGQCGWFPMQRHEIQAWVTAHWDTFPKTLAGVSRFPIPFRKVIVHLVEPDVRIALWREHLETFLATGHVLSGPQRTLVHEAIDALPEVFGMSRPAAESRARALEDQMRVLLSREQAARMFGMLGPPEPPEGLPLPPGAVPSAVG